MGAETRQRFSASPFGRRARALPSTGVSRLHRCYEPLRHPPSARRILRLVAESIDHRGEREAALEMVEPVAGGRRKTLGGDKAYDVREFAENLRALGVTPHIARKNVLYSAIDGRTTRHRGYEVSQRKRKRVEEIFGWLKTIGLMRKTRHRGVERVGWMFTFTAAAYNLVRMRNLAWGTG